MEKNKILVLVTSVFLIIIAILLFIRGQWHWGVILFLVVLVNLYWRISQKKWIREIY